jgi:glutamyl-tRNA synthetase
MYLQSLFGFPHPTYGHVPLLVAPDGRRLSKRDKDLDLGELRKNISAPALLGILAYSAGLIPKPEAVSPGELAREFSWQKLKSDSICLDGKILAKFL